MPPLLLPLLLSVTPGQALGLHSLCYFFSFLSEPLPGAPQYFVVGYVDDIPIVRYTSESRKAGPRGPWMEKITDEQPRFWEKSTETFREVKEALSDKLRKLMEQKNQSMGLHVFQATEGCELREDGSIKRFERYAYDGLTLPGSINQDSWDSEELTECIKYLKKLLKYREESLRRRVTPRTMVSQRKANDRTFLIGYAYGFYPRDIEVKWVQDGVEIPWLSKEVLPNPDGTYQVRTAVEVQEGDDVKTYEYHVNHSSLTETLTVTYEAHPRLRSLWLVLPVLGSVSVLLVAVLIWKRERLKRLFTTSSNAGSDVESSTSQGSPEAAKIMNGDASVLFKSEHYIVLEDLEISSGHSVPSPDRAL